MPRLARRRSFVGPEELVTLVENPPARLRSPRLDCAIDCRIDASVSSSTFPPTARTGPVGVIRIFSS
jgi:hypothetical protein